MEQEQLTQVKTLAAFVDGLPEKGLARTLYAIFEAAREVSEKIRTASCDSQCCFNTLGSEGEQFAIDLLATQVSR
jgi:hypothetical protein